MKILLLAAASDIHSVRWANQLSKNGNTVHLCYVANHRPKIDKLDKNVVLHELFFKAPYGYYLNVFQIKNIINKVKPDIINAHYASGYGTLGRLSGFKPYLISAYGGDVYNFPYKNKYSMNLIRKNLMAADSIASTSHAMAKQISKIIDYPVEKIHITPFGVDIEKFSRRRVSEYNDTVVIGSIKKLKPKYGIKYGILAIHHLVNTLFEKEKEKINIKYYIYGDGEERSSLEKLVEQYNLQNIVKFMGRIPNDEVPKALNDFDIFLGTSIDDSESFGVAIVEAMACEVPVIVTDVDGFKEVVDNGKFGFIVPRKDYKAMAEKIFELIKHPNLRKKLGAIERKRVLEEYNWIENVMGMENIYKELISNAGKFD